MLRLAKAYTVIAERLMPDRVLDNPRAAVSLVRNVLSKWSDGWLMVFDHLDNPSDLHGIQKFFPDGPRGSILVTSRYAGSKKLGRFIEVGRMEPEEGLELLLRSQETDTENLAVAEGILIKLGYLP